MRRARVLLLILSLAGAACSRPASPPATWHVMVTAPPLQNLALAITQGVPDVRVELLAPAAVGCMHDYQLTPRDFKALAQAQALFAVGLGYEPFLDRLRREFGGRVAIVTVGDDVEVLRQTEHEPGEETGGKAHHHADTAINNHPFVSPKQAAVMAASMASALARLDPSHEPVYQQNAAQLETALTALHQQLATFAGTVTNRRLVAHSSVFGYLLRDGGFEDPIVLTGDAHEDLSAGKVAALVAALKKTRPAAVLVEKQAEPRVARMVAQEIGVPLVALDVGLGGPAGPNAFLTTMQRLVADLQNAWPRK